MNAKVYYNEKCSICRLEIKHYKKNCKTINWIDINSNKLLKDPIQISKKNLIRKLHVVDNDKILIGIDAFIFIWSQII